MAETSNISQIAEILATKLFNRFLWNETGGWNQNWACVREDHVVEKRIRKKKTLPPMDQSAENNTVDLAQKESHDNNVEKKKILTHPSDVVFYYDEPYTSIRTYINTDLKSYKKDSITVSSIVGAIQSLALTLECAEISEEWQEKYVHEEKSYRIAGLLFVYNHDGEYDAGFDEVLAKVNHDKLKIPHGSKIVVLGPRDIRWLDNVGLDLITLHGEHLIPHEDHCFFYYPDLVQRKKLQTSARAATLEMLTGPWIILAYPQHDDKPAGYIVYFRGKGKHTEEFLYLLDHLMHYQMVKPGIVVGIRTFDADENAPAQFKRAVDEYIENYEGQDSDFANRLRKITFDPIPQMKSVFSLVKIGMTRG